VSREGLHRVLVAALLLSAAAAQPAAALTGPDAAVPAPSVAAPGVPASAAAPSPDPDGPLPPLQGHEAAEAATITVPDEDLIGRYVDGLLATRRDWLQAVRDRSARYRSMIAKALAERGMPRELGYLPAVESGFQARAVSPRGAAGLWQLMRNTASPYGLRMDLWVDERRAVEKATDASLEKLSENYSIFGDWYMALASYNCGVGRLSSILRRSPGSDFWDLRKKGLLPRETAAFVPQFLAIARILGHAGRYGFDLEWDPQPQWAEIPLDRPVDLRKLADAAGAPLDELLAGNPELNYLVTPPASYSYKLKVPVDYREAVTDALQGATMPLMEFQVHAISGGDTLFGMSLRYGVSLSLIQEFNPSVNPRALHIGAKVLIPQIPPRSQAK
jgi:membrane-bound lytic murein transglycosylase D